MKSIRLPTWASILSTYGQRSSRKKRTSQPAVVAAPPPIDSLAPVRSPGFKTLPHSGGMEAKVQVVCRLRPLNRREQAVGTTPVVTASTERKEVTIVKGSGKAQVRNTFRFDNVFGSFATQEEIFDQTLEPVIADVMGGFESTVFAYGQTGTGKTHTMEGDISEPGQWGVIPRAAAKVFALLGDEKIIESSVYISYLEIYNEELSDLLLEDGEGGGGKLMIAEDKSRGGRGVHCHGLSSKPVGSAAEVLDRLRAAQERRRVGETKMNKQSSRSHCLFTIAVRSKEATSDGMVMERTGKLHMCDLAGSECAKTAGVKNEAASRERERKNINQSLLTLGRVISALREGTSRIPYRDSKLTRLLQESLGGRCKTVIVATISPSVLCSDETFSTLNYAQRAHGIKNKPASASLRMVAGPSSNLPHCSPSKHAPPSGAQSWQELELKLQYMEAEMQEAQGALGKKHALMQEAMDKAEQLEADVKARDEAIEAARAELTDTLARMKAQDAAHRAKQAELEADIAQKQIQIQEGAILLAARCATEEHLRSEAQTLLSKLDASVADGQRMSTELQAMATAEQARRDTTQKLCATSTDALKNVQEETAAYSTAVAARQAELTVLAKQSVTDGKQGLNKLQSNIDELVKSVELRSSDLREAALARCDFSKTELEELVANHDEALCDMVAGTEQAIQSMREGLTGMVDHIKTGDSALAQWGETTKERLSAAGASLAAMHEQTASAISTTQSTLREGLQQHTGQLEHNKHAMQSLFEALGAVKADEQAHLSSLQSLEEVVESSLVQHCKLLKQQQGNIAAALESHNEGQLDSEQLTCLADINAIITSGATQLEALLKEQNEGMQKAILAQASGNAEAAHVQMLQTVQAKRTAATKEHTSSLQSQRVALDEAMQNQNAGNACIVHAENLTSANKLVSTNIATQLDLLSTQKAGLTAASQDLYAEQQDETQVLQYTRDAEAKLCTDTAHQMSSLQEQEQHLVMQREQLSAMVIAERAARDDLVQNVMANVQTLLQEQLNQLGSSFEQRVTELEASNKQMGKETVEVSTHISNMKESMDAIRESTVESTKIWGGKVRQVAQAIESHTQENIDLSKHLGRSGESYSEASAALQKETHSWGASNDAVAASIETTISANDKLVETIQLAHDVDAEQTKELVAQSQAWGASNREVVANIEVASAQNHSITEQVHSTVAAYMPQSQTAEQQVRSWGDSGREAAAAFGSILEENTTCQKHTTDLQQSFETESNIVLEQCSGLINSTSNTMESLTRITEENVAATDTLRQHQTKVEAGLDDAMTFCGKWGEHQASVILEEESQVSGMLDCRPGVLQQLEDDSAAIGKQLTETCTAAQRHGTSQQAAVTTACNNNSAAWDEYRSGHNEMCATLDQSCEEWTAQVVQAVESEIDRLDKYDEAQSEGSDCLIQYADDHSTQTGKAAETVSNEVVSVCSSELHMNQKVANPQLALPVEYSRELSATQGEEELLQDCRSARSDATVAAASLAPTTDAAEASDDTAADEPRAAELNSSESAPVHHAHSHAKLERNYVGNEAMLGTLRESDFESTKQHDSNELRAEARVDYSEAHMANAAMHKKPLGASKGSNLPAPSTKASGSKQPSRSSKLPGSKMRQPSSNPYAPTKAVS
jgi:hypothetical protein